MKYSIPDLISKLSDFLNGKSERQDLALWADEQQESGEWDTDLTTDPPGNEALVVSVIGDLAMVWEDDPNDPSVHLVPVDDIKQIRESLIQALNK